MKYTLLPLYTFLFISLFAKAQTPTNKLEDTGNVGIGTTTPNEKLEVFDSIDGSVYIGVNNLISGTNSASGIKFGFGSTPYDKGTFMYHKALDNTFYFSNTGDPNSRFSFITRNSTGNSIDALNIDSNGHIGIGTTIPTEKLDVNGNIKVQNGGEVIANGTSILTLGNTNGGLISIGGDPGTSILTGKNNHLNLRTSRDQDNIFFSTGALNANRMIIKGDSGNIGIGTSSPTHKLHVNIVDNVTQFKTYNYGSEITVNASGGWARGYRLRNENDNSTIVFGGHNGAAFIATGFDPNTDATGYQNKKLIINSNGDIGIGTETPDAKLAVKGNIHAEEVKVDLSVPGPDYVFEENYHLKPLATLKQYIQQHKHLPNIPSAKDMEANGIDLGIMNMKLLEKIEELTLYTIEQEKEIKTSKNETSLLKEKLKTQEQINQNLEARLSKLEKLVSSFQ